MGNIAHPGTDFNPQMKNTDAVMFILSNIKFREEVEEVEEVVRTVLGKKPS